MEEKLYRIGELSRLSGVSTATIRHYAEIGLLPPARIAPNGQRLFSRADRARLSLILLLRDLELDLEEIAALLRSRQTIPELLSLQAEALEMQMKMIKRQQTLLRAAAQRGEAGALLALERAGALFRLNLVEINEFLDRFIEDAAVEQPADAAGEEKAHQAWESWFWQATALELPEEMSAELLELWLEVVDLLSDEDFVDRMDELSAEFWKMEDPAAQGDGWDEEANAIYHQAFEASQEGEVPSGELAQELVQAWLEGLALAAGRKPTRRFAQALLDRIEKNMDTKMERFWELAGGLNRFQGASAAYHGFRWLMEGLRWRLEHSSGQTAVVVQPWQATYHDPLIVQAGEEVQLGRRDEDNPGWIWCTSEDDVSGWIPENYLDIQGDCGRLRLDYSSCELDVDAGEKLTLHYEESGWYWASKKSGEQGWVPVANVELD